MKLNHHDKKISPENPVGPELPEFRFDVPLWKVFVTLFLVALVLTAFKVFERYYVAPYQTVQWQDFDLALVQQEQRRRSNLMIKVNSGQDDFLTVFDSPLVRTAVYLDKTVCLQIDSELAKNEEVASWISTNVPQVANGGVCFTRSDGSPFQVADWDMLTPELIEKWIDP